MALSNHHIRFRGVCANDSGIDKIELDGHGHSNLDHIKDDVLLDPEDILSTQIPTV